MRRRSVVPPMPSEVYSDKAIAGRCSTPSEPIAARSLASSRRRRQRLLRSKQNNEFVAGAVYVSGADRKDGVGWFGLLQQILYSRLHRVQVMHVFVAGFADGCG